LLLRLRKTCGAFPVWAGGLHTKLRTLRRHTEMLTLTLEMSWQLRFSKPKPLPETWSIDTSEFLSNFHTSSHHEKGEMESGNFMIDSSPEVGRFMAYPKNTSQRSLLAKPLDSKVLDSQSSHELSPASQKEFPDSALSDTIALRSDQNFSSWLFDDSFDSFDDSFDDTSVENVEYESPVYFADTHHGDYSTPSNVQEQLSLWNSPPAEQGAQYYEHHDFLPDLLQIAQGRLQSLAHIQNMLLTTPTI
jgi:hypothetical protein